MDIIRYGDATTVADVDLNTLHQRRACEEIRDHPLVGSEHCAEGRDAGNSSGDFIDKRDHARSSEEHSLESRIVGVIRSPDRRIGDEYVAPSDTDPQKKQPTRTVLETAWRVKRKSHQVNGFLKYHAEQLGRQAISRRPVS